MTTTFTCDTTANETFTETSLGDFGTFHFAIFHRITKQRFTFDIGGLRHNIPPGTQFSFLTNS